MTRDRDAVAEDARPPTAAPSGIDVARPNLARVHDALLGGKDNYGADRSYARRVLEILPEAPGLLRANRALLGRAIRYLAEEAGIRQFIDVGCGLPCGRNVHEIAQEAAAQSRVVYVDNDDVVVAHCRAILAHDERTTVINGDMTEPAVILDDPRTRRLIDLERPVGLMLTSVLHLVPELSAAEGIVAAFRDGLPPGSHIVISHVTHDPAVDKAAELYLEHFGRGTPRDRDAILALFDGFELVPPGLVPLAEWRPDPASPSAPAAPAAPGGVPSPSRPDLAASPGGPVEGGEPTPMPSPMPFLAGVGRLP